MQDLSNDNLAAGVTASDAFATDSVKPNESVNSPAMDNDGEQQGMKEVIDLVQTENNGSYMSPPRTRDATPPPSKNGRMIAGQTPSPTNPTSHADHSPYEVDNSLNASPFVARTPESRMEFSPQNRIRHPFTSYIEQRQQNQHVHQPKQRHFCDLTPVTRNTSTDVMMDNGGAHDPYNNDSGQFLSSDMGGNSYSHNGIGQDHHLSLPSNLDDPQEVCVIPPLKLAMERGRVEGSCENNAKPTFHMQLPYQPSFAPERSIASAFSNDNHDTGSGGGHQNDTTTNNLMLDLQNPVQFPPPSGRFHTFTSREQYEQINDTTGQMHYKDAPSASANRNCAFAAKAGLKPYQPTQREHLLDHGIGALPEEELKSIFISRRTTNSTDAANFTTGSNPAADAAASSSHDYSANPRTDSNPNFMLSASSISENSSTHNLSHPPPAAAYDLAQPAFTMLVPSPFPIEERQWSIPSLHMANRLSHGGDGSTTATYTDDEDSILRMDDDSASLCSRESSLILSDDIHAIVESTNNIYLTKSVPSDGDGNAAGDVFDISSAFFAAGQNHHQHSNDNDDHDDDAEDDCDRMFVDDNIDDEFKRKQRRRKKKAQRVFEWLKQVEAGNDVFAEAASSKFLTGGGTNHVMEHNGNVVHSDTIHMQMQQQQHNSSNMVQIPLCRQSSTPTYPTSYHHQECHPRDKHHTADATNFPVSHHGIHQDHVAVSHAHTYPTQYSSYLQESASN